MKKVITYGSFDLFHEGHYRLLQRAKELGDYLIVGVTTEQYDEYRGKLNVVDSLMERIEHVKQTGFADQIVIEDHAGQKIEDIQKYGVDIFTVGSDWIGKFEYIREYCEVVYLERTKGISSTMLRQKNFDIICLGIIGSGRTAEKFIPEVKYVSGINAEVIYDSNIENAKKLADANELCIYTDKMEELYLNSDAVYIATQNSTHYEYIKDALKHGKHVLCEKPMVLKKVEAEELFALAQDKGLVLMEALETAYVPGFTKLVSMTKSGCVGKICDVEVSSTNLVSHTDKGESDFKEATGSFVVLGSEPILAVLKILGKNYQDIQFTSFIDSEGSDLYTKAYIRYDRAIAQVKVGLGVKSEDRLLISGTDGYMLTEAPWWMCRNLEICHEDKERNEKIFSRYLGQGLRYEIGAFVSRINGLKRYTAVVSEEDSILLAEIMEKYTEDRKNQKIIEIR